MASISISVGFYLEESLWFRRISLLCVGCYRLWVLLALAESGFISVFCTLYMVSLCKFPSEYCILIFVYYRESLELHTSLQNCLNSLFCAPYASFNLDLGSNLVELWSIFQFVVLGLHDGSI
jgi:hypothetical protein